MFVRSKTQSQKWGWHYSFESQTCDDEDRDLIHNYNKKVNDNNVNGIFHPLQP
jgi:hypothetical protein